jgi:hypothetical protein
MTFFDVRLGKLDELLTDGASFGKIEDWIEDQPIDDESKAALWLAAWSEQPRAQRREMVAPGPHRPASASSSPISAQTAMRTTPDANRDTPLDPWPASSSWVTAPGLRGT